MFFPKRVQSLRLSKWACQGGEYHLMFTHDQNRVFQWVLTRCLLNRHASLSLCLSCSIDRRLTPSSRHDSTTPNWCSRQLLARFPYKQTHSTGLHFRTLIQENAYSERLVWNQRVATLHCPHMYLPPWYCLIAEKVHVIASRSVTKFPGMLWWITYIVTGLPLWK